MEGGKVGKDDGYGREMVGHDQRTIPREVGGEGVLEAGGAYEG